MNAGIEWYEELEATGAEDGYDYKWWVETLRQFDRGWRRFWRARGMQPPEGYSDMDFRQQAHAECSKELSER